MEAQTKSTEGDQPSGPDDSDLGAGGLADCASMSIDCQLVHEHAQFSSSYRHDMVTSSVLGMERLVK